MSYTPKVTDKFLKLPSGWDDAWKAAKEASLTTPKWAALIGDSVGQGTVATNWYTGCFWAQLKTLILAKGYTNHGDHWHLGENLWSTGTYGGTAPWVLNVNPAQAWLAGFTRSCLWGAGPANPFATFVMPAGYTYTYTQLDLILTNSYVATSTTFTFTVDSTADPTLTYSTLSGFSAAKGFSSPTVTITVTLPASSNTNPPMRVRLTGLQNINHTLKLTTQSAANVCEVFGVSTYQDATKGIGWVKAAANGAMGHDWASNESCQPYNRARLWQGYTTTAQTDTGFGFPAQPALALIQLGINDCQNLIDLDQFEYGLRRLCQALRRGYDNCSIMFLHGFVADGESSDQTNNYMNPQNYQFYGDRIYSLADEFSCGVYNFQAKWGELGLAGGEVAGNDSHPVDAGHTELATTLAGVL